MMMDIKKLSCWVIVLGLVLSAEAQSAPPEKGSAKIVNKLQTMIKDLTAERDRIKVESDKTLADLDKLKKDTEKEKATALSEKTGLENDLASQKSSNEDLQNRLNATTDKLKEVIGKYNALNKNKNELVAQNGNLLNTQKVISSELKTCEAKNLKLYEVSKDVITGYKACQNKGILDTLVDSEPLLQINNVEFETLMQEFEDKLNKQKYHPQPTAAK